MNRHRMNRKDAETELAARMACSWRGELKFSWAGKQLKYARLRESDQHTHSAAKGLCCHDGCSKRRACRELSCGLASRPLCLLLVWYSLALTLT